MKELSLDMIFSTAHKIKLSEETQVYLLSYQPFENELYLHDLSSSEIKRFQTISNPTKKNEFVASRVLKSMIFPNDEIVYTENGAPYLLQNTNHKISISHTTGIVGLAVSKHLIGFDLEPIRGLAQKIHSKFINAEERNILNTNDIVDMTKAWSAKEVLYKLAGRNGISFHDDMLIEKVENKNLWISRILKSDGWWQYKIFFMESEGTILSANIDPGKFLGKRP